MTALNDALQLPLDGIRAVEASAGTGKSFTIATLYLRLLLERGLKVDEIVVATFTRAAAAELSERLRERLVIADGLLADADPTSLRDHEDSGCPETRKVIAQALHDGATLLQLRQRAHAARLAIDTAYIGTLHGFCHRALTEFGFDTGQALAQPELLEDVHELEAEIVRDFWRRGGADAGIAALLAEAWKSPEKLAQQVCDPRWRGRTVELPEPDFATLRGAFEQARQRIAAWDASATDAFEDELAHCVSTARTRSERTASLRNLLKWALAGSAEAALAAFDAANCVKLLPAELEKLVPKGVRPSGQVFDDVTALCDAHARLQQAETCMQELPAVRLLRDAHVFLEAERPRRLAERNLMGHDEAVDRLAAALIDGKHGARTAARIRTRWKAALVDEFQDTDPRQWQVVETLFGPTTLVLVGDPKQAIYGFRGGDVFAWLQARAKAEDPTLQLTKSWRSGAGLCGATNALFTRPGAFIEAGIEHPDITPAPEVAQRAMLCDGQALPALEVWRLDPDQVGHSERSAVPSKRRAQAAIERACVAWIAHTLQDPRLQLRDRHDTKHELAPKHFAVLVNSNREAHAMQAALGRAGVPASCNLRASVYASDEAADLSLLLDALAAPDDVRRARAARASCLVGDDAARIAAGIDDAAQQATLLEGIAAWVATVKQRGPVPWLHRLIADAAPRLLVLPDGQRRVANYLQLAELLQELHATSFGLGDLATRFARARVEASDDADTARLRLDTDANAVTIATVHAAKGLEYEVVLLPYAVLGRDPGRKQGKRPPLWWYHDAGGARVALGGAADDDVQAQALREIAAEEVRKLYVAVTRASALCALPYGPTTATEYSAVHHLLHAAGREQDLPADVAGCDAALHELQQRAGDAARVVALPAPAVQRTTPTEAPLTLHARTFTRTDLERDWQTWSFSRLVRGNAHHAAADPAPGAGDADAAVAATPADDFEPGLAGARFGSAVHAALERTDFAAWRDVTEVPDSERPWIERSLRGQGLAERGSALQHAVEVVAGCMRTALNTTLPCGVRLCEVAPAQRRAEIEFHLTLAATDTHQLYALLHEYGYQRQRSGVAPARLHGLLTGKIDLTFLHDGRFHIIDWKTNHCPPYDAAALAHAIALHDYDLQWLIYTLALHRWLRQQLPDYAYERHLGAVYYLFVRGMHDGRGVHVDHPPRALIEQLDALFGSSGGVA